MQCVMCCSYMWTNIVVISARFSNPLYTYARISSCHPYIDTWWFGYYRTVRLQSIVCKQSDSRGVVAPSTRACGGAFTAKVLDGDGRHFLQNECKHGRSLGSRQCRFWWQTGHVSRWIKPGFSSCADTLSASFSQTMIASPAAAASSSIFCTLSGILCSPKTWLQRHRWAELRQNSLTRLSILSRPRLASSLFIQRLCVKMPQMMRGWRTACARSLPRKWRGGVPLGRDWTWLKSHSSGHRLVERMLVVWEAMPPAKLSVHREEEIVYLEIRKKNTSLYTLKYLYMQFVFEFCSILHSFSWIN